MSNYAIIALGGKQYRVREGEKLLVERLIVDDDPVEVKQNRFKHHANVPNAGREPFSKSES